jgi:hypothetical protein
LTNAEWDHIEARAAENWGATWKAREEEYDLKEKKKKLAQAVKEKKEKEKSTATKDVGRKPFDASSWKSTSTPLVGVRRSARGLVCSAMQLV